ncbi:VC0807 family protein [Arthrobacter sp. MA-N2]|uniref:VC0807 family protein n=1 Tax=Arthrobacter sp. MA-N2 TaxID=1101188 RepID=UPI0004B2886D|nr:VC0807 family protein [Arthrobacter sp. MA-N2]
MNAEQASGQQRLGLMTRALVRGLAWDVGLPLAAYYVLHVAGATDWAALLAATGAAGCRLLWTAFRRHSLNPFAMLMVIVFGLGLVLSFLTGDPRFLLLKDSAITGDMGISFLAFAALGHPLTLDAAKTWRPERAGEMDREFHHNPAAHRWHLKISAVWGAGLIAEASARAVLVYLLPIDVMVGVSAALAVIVFAALIAWSVWDRKRQQTAWSS